MKEIPFFPEILLSRAADQPESVAFQFLTDGENAQTSLTYSALDNKARAIGGWLQQSAKPGERAMLMYPAGLDFIAAFMGCLYAGVIAVPAFPPRLNKSTPRLSGMLASAEACIALTTQEIYDSRERRIQQTPELSSLRWVATDTPSPDLADAWRPPALERKTTAFLQYTSGSTTEPKGVMVTHGNLLHNVDLIVRLFGAASEENALLWLPSQHDMGLIGGILSPIYQGTEMTLMAPLAFLQQPVRWLKAISRFRAVFSGGPDFAYELCVQKSSPEEIDALDLSCWELAFSGAEPVRIETIERFSKTFARCGFRKEAFYPCYGLAEATLLVSGGSRTSVPVTRTISRSAKEAGRVEIVQTENQDAHTLVSCGRIPSETQVLIVDPDKRLVCPSNQIGEIWVSGPSVAKGYWNQPQKTLETFQACLADSGKGPFLRTGDLGFLVSGELFISGRLKDLIIIRGRNISPVDVEKTSEASFPGVGTGSAAAFSIDIEGEERLVVVQEINRGREAEFYDIMAAIRSEVAEHHNVQAYGVVLVKLHSLPRTTSGKIQRHLCRAHFKSGALATLAESILKPSSGSPSPQTQKSFILKALTTIENQEARKSLLTLHLQEQIAGILGLLPAQVPVEQPIKNMGIDSLAAIELKYQVENCLDISLPLTSMLRDISIDQLSAELLSTVSASTPKISDPPLAATSILEGDHRLSEGQKSIWFLYQLAPESPAYNVSGAVRIISPLNLPALEQSFRKLVSRHSVYRTTFHSTEAGPVQRVHDHLDIDWDVLDASTWREKSLIEHMSRESNRPFILEEGPLLRVRIFQRSEHDSVALIVLHHIITDFWSLNLLVDELSQIYPAAHTGQEASLPAVKFQYVDFAAWQELLLGSEAGKKSRAYWMKQLEGELPALNLPCDHPRPLLQTFHGDLHAFRLGKALTDQVKALAKDHGATTYATLLASFQVLLYRYSGHEDMVVGTPSTGRTRAELDDIAGYLVNTLAIRTRPSPMLKFSEYLKHTSQVVLEAIEHQDYPFNTLVNDLNPIRIPSRSPLFQVMFVFQKARKHDSHEVASLALNLAGSRMELGGLKLESLELPHSSAQFDLTLFIGEADGELVASIEYNTDLFEVGTIARMEGHFKTLLAGITAQPDQLLAKLPLIDSAERNQLLVEWNNSVLEHAPTTCVHQFVEAQAQATPESLAVLFDPQEYGPRVCKLSYKELNQRANQLAHYLLSRGIGPGKFVGVYLERSLDMVVSVLGILIAGGAYVPLDPAYPEKRLALMIEDAKLAALITHSSLETDLPACGDFSILCLDAERSLISEERIDNPDINVRPVDPAYVIYTSGSTGVPKGIVMPHQPLVNLIEWQLGNFSSAANARTLQFTSLSFDVSFQEIFSTWGSGGTLVLVPNEIRRDMSRLCQFIEELGIERLFLPFVALHHLAESLIRRDTSSMKLKEVITAGEQLQITPAIAKMFEKLEHCALHNQYGPAESHVVTAYTMQGPSSTWPILPPIGRPVSNTQIFILDQHLQPVPVNIPGELYIGGVALAQGYLNMPGLTSERFPRISLSGEQERRLYKTGDQARWTPDGNIEFICRVDHQVKIRGFRVELGEVEAALRKHPDVRECVVLASEAAPGEKRLAAYVILDTHQQLSQREVRSFLKNELPEYMIPSSIMFLDSLPLTPSGKVDRRSLPVPDRASLETAFVAPRNDLERAVVDIWQQSLNVQQIGIDDSFFELGGHSLLAAQVTEKMSEILSKRVTITDLFTCPTIRGSVHLAEEAASSPLLNREYVDLQLESHLDEEIRKAGGLLPADKTANVFLTGATGFIGAFLLHELLLGTQGNIYCLVRADTLQSGLDRIINNLKKYALDYKDYVSRLVPLPGDLSKPFLGLGEEKFWECADIVDAIYHAGATVSFVLPYQAVKASNVSGTEEILRLATTSKQKPVNHVSTLAVFSSGIGKCNEGAPINEEKHPHFEGYAASKWVAEHLVKTAELRGIPCSIYRLGRITGHSQTGICNLDDFFYRLLVGCARLGFYPEPLSTASIDLTPVDFAARSIIALSQQRKSIENCFHVMNPCSVDGRYILEAFANIGLSLTSTPYELWMEKIGQHVQQHPSSPFHEIIPVLEKWGPSTWTRLEPGAGWADCSHTKDVLAQLGVECPQSPEKLVDVYISYLDTQGVFSE